MKRLSNFIKRESNITIASILFIAFILRFINLGYSDFQGDEIKALFLPLQGQSLWDFLLSQRKGPLQFLVTFLLRGLSDNYSNYFITRLPFAVAGFLAVYFFYRVILHLYGKRTAYFATFFMATNGFIVAFSRIAQYQSFVILFGILSLYFMLQALRRKNFRLSGLYLSFGSLAISLLFHYDGIFFGIPLLYLFILWIRSSQVSLKQKWLHVVGATVCSGIALAIFYIPFFIHVSTKTYDYWQGRLDGSVSDKLSSSLYLFTVYQPIYVIHIYTALGLLGLAILLFVLSSNLFKKTPKFRMLSKMAGLIPDGLKFSPGLIFTTLCWLGVTVIFWEFIVYIPGTHIYTYLIPLFVVLGIALSSVDLIALFWSTKFRVLFIKLTKDALIIILFVFIAAQSYMIFVDNYQEYPWTQEKFLIWDFHTPTPMYHLSLFGFPYNRDWKGISEFVQQHPEVTAYSTNERESISRYHIKLTKSTDEAGFYIYIREPQSFANNIQNEKFQYWAQRYEPVYTLSRRGIDIVSIYNMAPGPLEKIIKDGY